MSFFPIVLTSISTSGHRWTLCFLQDKILRMSEAVNCKWLSREWIRVWVTITKSTDSIVWNSLESFWIPMGFFYGGEPWGDINLFFSWINFYPNLLLRHFSKGLTMNARCTGKVVLGLRNCKGINVMVPPITKFGGWALKVSGPKPWNRLLPDLRAFLNDLVMIFSQQWLYKILQSFTLVIKNYCADWNWKNCAQSRG